MPNPEEIREKFRTLPTVPAFRRTPLLVPPENKTWVEVEGGARFVVWKEQAIREVSWSRLPVSLTFCSLAVMGERFETERVVNDFNRVFGEFIARKILEDPPRIEFVLWNAASMRS